MQVRDSGFSEARASSDAVTQSTEVSAANSPQVSAPTFRAVAEVTWRGTLTYRNYSDGKSVSIPSNVRLERQPPSGPPTTLGTYKWMTGYDDEPHADSATMFSIIEGGRALQFGETIERVVAFTRTPSTDQASFALGTRVIITEHIGEDDEKPATIRKVYTLLSHNFSVQKLVRVQGNDHFFERHIYRWSRE
jgi:hypothetical protein